MKLLIHFERLPAMSLQLCSTLCDAEDCSPPGSSVHGILQARMLEWVEQTCGHSRGRRELDELRK